MDPVCYTVNIAHWNDGTIDITVLDVGDDEQSRLAVAEALRRAAAQVEEGQPYGVMH